MGNKVFNIVRRMFLIVAGSALMAFTVKTFVQAGGIVPAGFTGTVLLIQEVCWRNFNVRVPFSILYYIFNAVPGFICFKFVGKKFALYSLIVVFLTGLFIDWMPPMFIERLQLHDTLLSAVFGGLLYGLSSSLVFRAGTTSGGTDFIAICISERYRKDSFSYIFMGNCVILAFAGYLFDLNTALYSIIFQYVSTVSLKALYQDYQQRTLLIITNMPDEIFAVIDQITHHGATYFDGQGSYEKSHRIMLYSVVTASEVKKLIPAIRKIDPAAFINVLRTELINGQFYMPPKS